MISEADFQNLNVLREAARAGHVGLVASREVATGQPCALVCTIEGKPPEAMVTPIAALAVDAPVTDTGELSPDTQKAFASLKILLSDRDKRFYFREEASGKVQVFSGRVRPRPLMTLAWDNPIELFG